MPQIFILIFLLIPTIQTAFGSVFDTLDQIRIDENFSASFIGNKTAIFGDKEGNYTVDQIATSSDIFQTQTIEVPNFGYSAKHYWVAFKVKNIGKLRRIYISYEYPLMQNIEVYKLSASKVQEIRRSGKDQKIGDREYGVRNFVFAFDLLKDEEANFLLQMQTKGAVSAPIKVHTDKTIIERYPKEYFGYAIYFGGLLFLAIYNLFIYIYLKDRSYLYYVSYIAWFGITQLALFGFSQEFFLPNDPDINRPLVVFSAPMSLIFLTLFTQSFLPSGSYPRFAKFMMWIAIAFNATISAMAVFAYGPLAIRLTGLTASVTSIILITAALFSFKQKTRESRFFLSSLGFFLMGAFLYGLKDFNIIGANIVTRNSLLIGSALEIIGLSVGLADKINILREGKKKLDVESATSHAIARTTQSLAHDVRKPFTMFKMIIDAVDGEDDPQEAKQILRESLPEVQQAMASVNGMIADVLEIGSESAPVVESANPETLIEATLNEIFRVYPDSQVNVTYSLNHKHKVSVDTLKISRVFSNIVGNAVQAMRRKGSLWFKTEEIEEDGKSFILFCLGNGGSFIPAENLPKLFDAFFTSGKKGGTGLGLAIAQKIVLAHGGKIWCESDAQRGVEFFFTLPKTVEQTDPRPHALPTSSAAIVATFERLRGHSQSGSRVEVDPLEVSLEKEIIKLVQAIQAPLHVLIVDDEGVYRNSLAALVNRSDDLKEHLHLSFAVNSAQALEAAKTAPALVIQDVDLGKDSLNGYEVLKAIRAQGFQGVVCIHSNRSLPEDYRVAVDAGADAVLPKPMSRSHFLKLALQASQRIHDRLPLPAATHTSLPEFAVVDDSSLVLRAWQRKSKGQATVHTFESPDAFRAAHSADPGFLARLCFVVTDFYFAQGVTDTGLSFGQELKKVFAKPVLLSSDGEFNASDLAGCVDAVIAKDPVGWVELSTQMEAFKRPS